MSADAALGASASGRGLRSSVLRVRVYGRSARIVHDHVYAKHDPVLLCRHYFRSMTRLEYFHRLGLFRAREGDVHRTNAGGAFRDLPLSHSGLHVTLQLNDHVGIIWTDIQINPSPISCGWSYPCTDGMYWKLDGCVGRGPAPLF